MRQYKLTIAYDGTDYYGWQNQKEQPSIIQAMQKAYYRVFHEQIKLVGASRTDAGVHALGQVATFKTALSIDPRKMLFAWNNALPAAIRIITLEEVSEGFHPYRTNTVKTYWYHFFTECPLPIAMRYAWYISRRIDMQKLTDSLRVIVGKHDFASFCTQPLDNPADTIRTILSIDVEYISFFGCYRIVVKGTGFLRHMIRRIVGASMTIAMKDQLSVSYMQEILRKKDANNVLPTAPAQGLLLYEIKYVYDTQ